MANAAQTTMPAAEKIGLAFALLTAIVLLCISIFSLIIDIIVKFDIYGVVVDFIVLGIGIFLGYFSIRMYKKSAYYESLMNTAFDSGVYERLEPVLRKVAETNVEMEDMQSRLNKIDHMVQTVLDGQVKMEKSPHAEEAIAPGTSMGFLAKTILLAVICLAGFIIVTQTFLSNSAHLVTLVFFFLWWLLISSEFNVFDKNTTWIVLFVPIILVPVSSLYLSIFGILEINNLVAIFYVCLALYAFLYYSWAVYETKGTLPFNLDFSRFTKNKRLK